MDSALLLLKLLPLLLLCCTGPGLLIVSRLRWSPLEKLCGALAASFVAIYLASFMLFCLNAPAGAYWATSCFFAILIIPAWPTVRLLLKRRQTRTALLAFATLLAWHALHMAMVRNYSGGPWQGDWREHYQRTQYFVHELPHNYRFLGVYALPARPPLMNLIAAFFCRQVGVNFQAYQTVFVCLNAWAFFPCCLLIRFFARRAGRFIFVLTALFMLNPSIVQNATLTWTKAFTAGLVILGICFYLRGKILPAALTLAAGILAHYSAAPYAAAVALHCLLQMVRRRQPARPALIAAGAAAALLATWFVWSTFAYGTRATVNSTSTYSGIETRSAEENLSKILHNLLSTAVPHPLRPLPANYQRFRPPRNWGDIRDYYFLMAQTTLPNMVGLTSGLVALGLFARFCFAATKPRPRHQYFWMFLFFFAYVVGISAEPAPAGFGAGAVTLQSLALIGVTLVAARLFRLPTPIFWLVWAGVAVDYALGILLEFNRESYTFLTAIDHLGRMLVKTDRTLGSMGAHEYVAKMTAGYTFWGDQLAGFAPALQICSAMIALCTLTQLARARSRFHSLPPAPST